MSALAQRAGTQTVALAAGGTGGHMFPARALAEALIARGHRVVLVTDRRGAGFGADLPRVETHRIRAGGIAGLGLLGKLTGVLDLGIGYLQARGILASVAPDAVVSFGGYASLPTALAAAHQGRRLVIHEQNAVMGRANRMLAGRAAAVALCFKTVTGYRAAPRAEERLTGNPVRPAITALGKTPFPGIVDGDALRLLVVGGSQGARVFNEVVPDALTGLPDSLRGRLRLSQQVPGNAIAAIRSVYDRAGIQSDLAAFFDDMPRRLGDAHLVIGRAGASTVAELCAAGRPAILVPFPHATDDHQTANARALADAGGAWLLPQSHLDAETLRERLIALLSKPATLDRAASRARALAQNRAAERLADLVHGDAGRNGNGDAPPAPEREAAAR